MGTLVTKSNTQAKKAKVKVIDLAEEESKFKRKIDKKIAKEYAKIRMQLEDVRIAFRYLEDAESHDDIYFRLAELEKATKNIRKGSFFSRGAKTHRQLLRTLSKSKLE